MSDALWPESLFTAFTMLAWVGVVVVAALTRGRGFAIFAGVMLGVHGLISVALWPHLAGLGLGPVVVWLQLATYLHFGSLLFPRLRSWPWRVLVSWSGLWWGGAIFLALPWAVIAGLGLQPIGWWLPFAGVMLGVHGLISVALWPHLAGLGLGPVVVWLQLATYLHFGSLLFPRLRSWPWRVLVSWSGLWWGGAIFLALPWAVVAGLGLQPIGWWLPFVVGLVGLWQSLRNREEAVDLVLDGEVIEGLQRQPHGQARSARPLRIVQITDPHLGPFMSVARLRGVAERAVAADPDLVLLTGDYLTMESQATPGCLAEALAPLRALEGRVFACRGNHDLEAPDMVARELAEVGARLLVDEATLVETTIGPVQIVGMDFRWRGRAEHAQAISSHWPRVAGALRVVLLHDPGAFVHLRDGEADLVLSGHTHGGQVGLVSLGLPWTAVSALSKVPDHGFWARGRNRLYVNRAAGHYGFPLRVGVPGEEGVLQVHTS